ncbi:MAG: class I SAM-dependent methyltransferase [Myxococcales bacterium]|nr:class I SAM-dependent methyltransferase [Myxococcales bacterium]
MTRPPRPGTRRGASGPRPEPDRALAVALGAREHYRDAALYDYEYRRRRDDVAFYVELAGRVAGPGGRVLELGCGTGRITAALARAGFEVVALDAEPAMLAGLAARMARLPRSVAARITPVTGDLRDFALQRRFPLILAGFNVLEHLYTRVELEACLGRVRAHLAVDGAFAFDVQLPDPGWLARDPVRRWARTRFRHPVTGVPTWYTTNHDYDPVSQIAIIRIYYQPCAGGPEDVVLLSQRKYFPAELEALIAHAGLRVAERYGSFERGPLGPDSDSQILVCGRARARTKRHPRRA